MVPGCGEMIERAVFVAWKKMGRGEDVGNMIEG
jgi:hypothetical protein